MALAVDMQKMMAEIVMERAAVQKELAVKSDASTSSSTAELKAFSEQSSSEDSCDCNEIPPALD